MSDARPLILCTTDLTDAARTGLREGLMLASDLGGRVEVVHVAALNPVSHLAGSFLTNAQERELTSDSHARAKAALEALCEEVSTESVPVSPRLILSEGPAEALCAHAAEAGAAYIVAATHGHEGTRRFLMGSVSERIVRLAGCPVLVVPRRDAA